MYPIKAEKRSDGYWYLVDKDGFCLAEIKGPSKEKHEEIANEMAEYINAWNNSHCDTPLDY